ncbi:hypothetical protein M422DRAFT_51231 [Sphaerobolus stellatus SS14]|uniref:Uncharacterized protein n=1 Tax=Sphaerobolus stellatus (strain SS14) TaxID=990650 RepID=A0A0C9VEJ2_SPHS4|nr:hypothetical protein M422DRAFT_51231 [Sphaerobolus stellatus SS14]
MLGQGIYLHDLMDIYSQLYLDPKYHISQLEWEVLQDIYDILEPLHAAQTLMGAEKMPMAPLYFPFYFGLISALEHNLSNSRYSYLYQVFEAAIDKLKEHIDDMWFSKAVILSTSSFYLIIQTDICFLLYSSYSSCLLIQMVQGELATSMPVRSSKDIL